jgi:hypothetical protein
MKCKSKTQTINEDVVRTSNGKYRKVGNCNKCNTKKSQFISKKEGEGILGKLLFPKKGKVPILGDIPLIGNIILSVKSKQIF